jgi:hypothetical protein
MQRKHGKNGEGVDYNVTPPHDSYGKPELFNLVRVGKSDRGLSFYLSPCPLYP